MAEKVGGGEDVVDLAQVCCVGQGLDGHHCLQNSVPMFYERLYTYVTLTIKPFLYNHLKFYKQLDMSMDIVISKSIKL